MAKNKFLIEQMKNLHKSINNITPQVYAGIALALHREYGWGYKRINRLFALSEEIWDECTLDDRNMVQMCLDETGIDIRTK